MWEKIRRLLVGLTLLSTLGPWLTKEKKRDYEGKTQLWISVGKFFKAFLLYISEAHKP